LGGIRWVGSTAASVGEFRFGKAAQRLSLFPAAVGLIGSNLTTECVPVSE
jgi:hypothetical protein